jgi:hypothetical protein
VSFFDGFQDTSVLVIKTEKVDFLFEVVQFLGKVFEGDLPDGAK